MTKEIEIEVKIENTKIKMFEKKGVVYFSFLIYENNNWKPYNKEKYPTTISFNNFEEDRIKRIAKSILSETFELIKNGENINNLSKRLSELYCNL